ncbi:PREDICTED: fatty acid synthase-like, partial [Wasmannia auropunctata]|uniref:fatty acid synthase-like n=1 Tax=Wasmannia auropunctata TaxID=64793 RepID=UPI0005EE8E30
LTHTFHSIRWNHSEDWYIPTHEEQQVMKSRERYVEIIPNDEDYEYVSGHVIDGRILFPATGYLVLVWQTIGMMTERIITTVPIIFQDVKFIRATHLSKNNTVELRIAIQKDGKFEITEGESVVVTGIVRETSNLEQEMTPIDQLPENNDEEEHMTARDIYKELKLRGYQYSGLFRGLKSASISGKKGHIIWRNNWVTFMDNMLQMHIIGYDTRNLYIPTSIQKLVINPMLHALKLRNDANVLEATTDKDKQLSVRVSKELDTIIAGGIEIRGLKAFQISRRKLTQDVVIEKHIFVAHCDRAKISLNEAIRISAQLALEDHQVIKIKVIELVEDDNDIPLEYLSSSLLNEAFNDMPLIQTNITLLTSPNRFNPSNLSQNISVVDWNKISIDDKALIVVGFNLLTKRQTSLERLLPFLREGGYLLTREKYDVTDYKKYLQQYELNVILEKRTDKETIVLLKKKILIGKRTVVYINNDNFSWLEELKSLVSDENKLEKNSRIIIVGERDFECGLLGFVNCLRKEPAGELVRGQAAIHLALNEGCEVFTTVGTSDKRNFIKQMFPTILDERIGNSRDTSFEQMIMQQTKGRGVDIVLNSLAEEKLIASVRCLARNGHFLEIGKFDLVSNNPLGISAFQKGISFHGIQLDNMFTGNNLMYKSLLSKMVTDGLNNGTVKPLQVKIFPKTDIEEAFRYMASGKHMGKIIINIQEKYKPLDNHILAYRRYYCLKDKSYVILGGLGGFGLELTDWLIFRGARNVVLISRTGIKNGYQRMKVQLWKSYGVNVLIIKDIDVANIQGCEYLLRIAEREGPVDAIFNLGVVLKDSVLENQTAETFAESFQSKARATQILDKLTRKICPKLRHFVVFSSVSCGRGNAGQTNYGMANSVMERICEKRVEEGLPGLAIQWGAVGDVGLVADMQEEDKEVIIGSTLQQKISCCLDELDKFLLQNQPIVSSMVVAKKKAGSYELGSIVETVANILDIKDMKFVSQHLPLAEFGMDSMMAVEIKQTLEREFDIFFTAQEIINLTFAKLMKVSDENVRGDTIHNKQKLVTKESNAIKYLIGIIKDEDFISQPCFDLPTKRQKATTEVFLIPGVDGCGTVFNRLAPDIEFSATSLHYNTSNIDAATNIISGITDYFTNHILPKLRDGKDFVVVGYSFGSIIAVELTRKLEAMNFTGRLILIDGAPKQIRMIYKHFIESKNTDLQIAALTSVMEVYGIGNSKKILVELKECNTWEERYNIFAKQFLATNTLLSPANLKTLCTTIYRHLLAAHQYDPSTLLPIKSPITLLKPTKTLHIPMTEEDYGLQKITKNVVKVHYIEGTHVTILKNEKVTAAINGQAPYII